MSTLPNPWQLLITFYECLSPWPSLYSWIFIVLLSSGSLPQPREALLHLLPFAFLNIGLFNILFLTSFPSLGYSMIQSAHTVSATHLCEWFLSSLAAQTTNFGHRDCIFNSSESLYLSVIQTLWTQHVPVLTDDFPLKPFSPFAPSWWSKAPQTPASTR